ncbi:ATP-binding protein [Geobacter pickeringii]|uniref:ATP-binding protein n=1 Tax=Geobacter pickeringii TaxID=345632 RepID=UPI000ADF5F82|nr:ATP-binding protein [Geobacter pickeringii]
MTTRPTITQIENAFQPSREIIDAVRFAGRKEAVRDSYYALLSDGANIAVVGNRGIGKTSLARQISNIGTGENSILEKLGINNDRKLDFLTIYFACGKAIGSTNELLEKLLTNSNCLADWAYDIPKAKKLLSGYSPKFSAKALAVGIELGAEKKEEVCAEPVINSHSIDTVFTNVANALSEQKIAEDGLLIVIDEFDQIGDVSGFASFLKALSTNATKVRFCIVGVAKDIQALMKEHASSDRLFAGSIISLPSMSSDELKEIITIAEHEIDNYIIFEPDAREQIVTLAQGHPYMVHLIGKYSLRHAYQEDKQSITKLDIDLTLKSIAERGADPVLEGRYRKAVSSSPQREIVLRALAESQDAQGEVWTSNAYKIAIDRGVDNPSQYVGQLVTEQYGAEIENLRDRYYRFKDSLFAAYVKAHPRILGDGADIGVDSDATNAATQVTP